MLDQNVGELICGKSAMWGTWCGDLPCGELAVNCLLQNNYA